MRRPRLNSLRTFEAAARRLSFSLAAEELNISQAAVSQQMRALEAYLGAPLFHRHHRRISLTSVGRTYLSAVQEALDRLDTITDQLFPDRPDQSVSIRCSSMVATLWLAPRIDAFRRAFSHIDLHIRTLDYEPLPNQQPSTDFEVLVAPQNSETPLMRPLFDAQILPVASAGFLAGQGVRRPQDLLACNLIHILGYENDWHRWFKTHHTGTVTLPHGLTVDSSLFAIDAALRGDGVILGRRPFIDKYLQSGALKQVFAPPLALSSTYYLRHHAGRQTTRNKQAVFDWLLAQG